MATIVTKNSSTASSVPVPGDLVQGELAVNVTDKKIYTKDSGGTVVVLAEPAAAAEVTLTNTATLTNKTLTAAILDGGYSEEVFALGTSGSLALDPSNGSIQTCALTGNPTFTDSLAAGESIVLMLTNGSSYTVTFPTITWVSSGGNVAPTLTASDVVVMWKVSTTLYGAWVGSGV